MPLARQEVQLQLTTRLNNNLSTTPIDTHLSYTYLHIMWYDIGEIQMITIV